MKAIVCDLCDKRSAQKGDELLPEQWASLRIANKARYYDEYHLCPECVPGVGDSSQRANQQQAIVGRS